MSHDFVENRVKHKKRYTYPHKHNDMDHYLPNRRKSDPSTFSSDESSERCVIKEYSNNHLKKKIVLSKRSKIHPVVESSTTTDLATEDNDVEIITKCLAIVSKKIVRLLCYLGMVL